ncbi:hypothetical protein TSUD_190450 [Trifolium subterraneum]|uniref:CCHC-type domain-containing protein n=1 Tax=Trifolium subterraneum TaxID=3900 RepID=A0A2Z6NYU5_TRISU|nr:hypothetical protein TSUD_190450 [Trifolium subterraneum]
MGVHGETLTEGTIVENILRSLTSRFNYVVCSIEEANDVTTMSVDQLQSSLIVQERRMKGQKDQEEQVLKISHGGRGTRGRGNGNGNGRGRGCSTGGRSHKFNKENIECYKCHKLGHFQSECPNWEEYNANYAQYDEEEEILLMAQETKDSVKLGDDSKMAVMGRGNLKLRIEGFVQVLTNVYYLTGVKNNLISIGQLQQKSITVIFKNDTCKVFHDDKGLIMTTHMSMNRMYIIKAPVVIPKCLKVTQSTETQLWHQRYVHLRFIGMKILAQKKMVHGLPYVKEPNQSCTHCMKGKQQRETVPKKSSWRASTKLELIHSDICGPINPESNGKMRQLTTAYTPQQNGIFERKNKTIIMRSPTFAVKDLTPEEAWSARLSDESKAYKMYDPIKRKIIIGKDVKFDESKQWNWDTKEIKKHKSAIVDTYSETYSTSKLSDNENEADNDSEADDHQSDTPENEVVPDSEDDEVNEGTLGKKISRKSGYLYDFVTDDEALHNLAIFSPSEDPTTYDEAAKLDMWRNAMNYNEQGKVEKHKARLVAKGYFQQHGIDYNEVFAPVARWDTIRTILAIAALRGWYIYQLDVKSAFLHGELNEEVYVEQPLGYQKERKELVHKLKKSLYGLKQAPRAWYNKIESYSCHEGFEKCPHEHTLFVKHDKDNKMIVVSLYVDDMIFTAEILKRFGMSDYNSVCNPMVSGNKLKKDENGKASDATNYKQMVGCLIYLKGTLSHGLWYERGKRDELIGWSDSDYAGDVDDRRSTSGFVFTIGSKAVSWSSKKQHIITLSTTEAEFIAAASSACKGIWLSRIISQIEKRQEHCITIFCDNSSSIKLSRNPVMHGRSKHIDVRFHFLRDLTKDGVIQLKHCSSFEQVADIMTKVLTLESFYRNRDN